MNLKIINKNGTPATNAIFVKLNGEKEEGVKKYIYEQFEKRKADPEMEFIIDPELTAEVNYNDVIREIFDADNPAKKTVWVPDEEVYDNCYKDLPLWDKVLDPNGFLRINFSNENELTFIPEYPERSFRGVYANSYLKDGLQNLYTRPFTRLMQRYPKECINVPILKGETFIEAPINITEFRDPFDILDPGMTRCYWINLGLVDSIDTYQAFLFNVCHGQLATYDGPGTTPLSERDVFSGLIGVNNNVLTIEESVLGIYNILKSETRNYTRPENDDDGLLQSLGYYIDYPKSERSYNIPIKWTVCLDKLSDLKKIEKILSTTK